MPEICAYGETQLANASRQRPCCKNSPATKQPAAKIEIPIELNDNLIIVKAIVGGQRNVNMILDTATQSLIDQESA